MVITSGRIVQEVDITSGRNIKGIDITCIEEMFRGRTLQV